MTNQKEAVLMDLHTLKKAVDVFEEDVRYPHIPFMAVDKDGLALKTVDQICIEVDNAETHVELKNLYSYLFTYGRSYPLIYLRYIVDHFQEKARVLNERRGLFNRPYMK